MDTIFALATAFGKAGVAIVRISGPKAVETAQKMCGSLPAFRYAGLRTLLDDSGTVLDNALVLTFPEKQSFTGEEVVELHVHGSNAVVSAVLRFLSVQDGLRMAEAGEFTRRALENGMLDLAQVEGLGDLIDAETEAQRIQANRVLSGELGDKAEQWRVDLIRAAALIEATIDFADEDVPVDVSPEVGKLLDNVMLSLRSEIEGVSVAERVRSGFEVAIVGAPNVGKSTLLNALAGRDAAITSEIAGTTRDVIEVRMDIAGLPVTLLDTAGIRETDDTIENLGIERALSRAATADLRVFLVEGNNVPELNVEPSDIVLNAKGDLFIGERGSISGKTGLGVSELLENIAVIFADRISSVGIATHSRHRVAMESSLGFLSAARNLVVLNGLQIDIAAEEIRSAIRSLDSLVGRIDVENLLDEIFLSFCIGK